MRSRSPVSVFVILPLLVLCWVAGCVKFDKPLRYIGDKPTKYYKDVASEIDYPKLEKDVDREPVFWDPPRGNLHPGQQEIWDLTLQEALHMALANSHILRTRGQFLSPANPLLANPDQMPSIYDPAIQESGVLFGARGVEAALADFDTQFSTSILWGRNELVQNNQFLSGGLLPGSTLTEESAAFTSRLEKTFATGATVSLNHNWNYSWNNVPSRLFPSTYTGLLQAEYRHPLLAGSGTEFNRISGPVDRLVGGVTGVDQGVVIARINNDITLADFETAVRNLLKDVEDVYWDLALAYRVYDVEIRSRNRTLEIWRVVRGREASAADQAQARDNYYENRARAENALADLYQLEEQLRRLLGLPVNDGRIIRPVDEPFQGEFIPDWYVSLATALSRRSELRRQQWNIKSLEFQLQAARSLVRPRLDFVSRYQLNGFGNHLLAGDDDDGVTEQGFDSAYETITQGNQTGWNLGIQMELPLGLRTAHAQVRNIELRLAKARRLLAEQEFEVSHELANSFQELERWYQTAQSNFNRQQAAAERVEAFERAYEAGGLEFIDPVLRAQISLAQAEIAYFRSIVEYTKSITDIHFREGSLLEQNSVYLAEDRWDEEAYRYALRRARARSHAVPSKVLRTRPLEFEAGGMIPPPNYVPDGGDSADAWQPTPHGKAGSPAEGDLPTPLDEDTMPPPPPDSATDPLLENGDSDAAQPPTASLAPTRRSATGG